MRFVPDVPLIPAFWLVCFVGMERRSIWDWFLPAGYRHAFLLGYLPDVKQYLLYEVLFWRTTVALVSPALAGQMISGAAAQGGALVCHPPEAGKPSAWLRFGFWCVPAIKHVLGLRCVAVTPKGLHDFLVRNGAKPLLEKDPDELRIVKTSTGRPGGEGGA